MAVNGIGVTQKIVPLEEARAGVQKASDLSPDLFEQKLQRAEREYTGQVVPLPLPSHPQPVAAVPSFPPAPSFPHALVDPNPHDEVEQFLDHIDRKIKDLECSLLSLNRQVSALLRCL